MLNEIEQDIYDKYIKEIVVYENGEKKVTEEDLEKLNLPQNVKNFISSIINKQGIKVIEKIERSDRSPYVRDNNYGNIKVNELQKIDEPVMSKIEYSPVNEKIHEDYSELDKYLETRFIPTYILIKKSKKENGKEYMSISLHHILALRLSEAEFEHVMAYLKDKNINVRGKDSTVDGEFENYNYVNTYKESKLPLSVDPNVTLKKICEYKINKDLNLRNEIVMDNKRLVSYVTYRYAIFTGIDEHELESYGDEGLIFAVNHFDIESKWKFSTYAVACIRGYILNGIVELLNGKRDNFYYNYINAKSAVERENGMTLTDSPELIEDVIDLLVATGKIKDSEKTKQYAERKIMSLEFGNASLDDEEEIQKLYDNGQLVDPHDYEEEVLDKICSDKPVEELEKMLLDELTKKEIEVIKLRFGLEDGKSKTLVEVGQMLGVSGERIRQIESEALSKLYRNRKNGIIK